MNRVAPSVVPATPPRSERVAFKRFAQALAIIICSLACALCMPAVAHADEAPPDVPRLANGTCHIGDTWMVGEQSFFTIPSFSGLLAGCVPASTFECLNHTAAAPEHVDASYEATLTGCSLSGGWVEYYVTITPPDATDGHTSNEYGLVGYQRVGGTVRLAWEFKGGIALQKGSSLATVTEGNACYSLAGATYGVFDSIEAARARDATFARGVFTTGSDGSWASGNDFIAGTYYIAELEAPQGYALSDEVVHVTVGAGETTSVSVSDQPLMGPAAVRVQKRDAETGAASAQGDATLEGAEVTFCYYDGIYTASNLPSTPTRSWTMLTDAGGLANLATGEPMQASGDGFYRDAEGGIALPLGTVTARETRAPQGYRPDSDELYLAHITPNPSGGSAVIATVAPTRSGTTADGTALIGDSVQRGRLVVGKTSRENGSYLEQGAASLAGWTFEIVNRSSYPVVVDGATFASGEVVKTIATNLADGAFVADTGQDCLPYGTYEVREIATMRAQDNGYLFDTASSSWSRVVSVREDGQVIDMTDAADACANQVVRGDLSLSKAKSPGMERLAGIPFKVTSATTGEWHVIVTDRNGMAATASDFNAHASKTNANDAALKPDGTVDESALDDEAGIWFSGRVDAPTAPNEGKGALPFDTYIVEELPVTANAGLDLVTIEASVYRDAMTIDLGTIEDTAGATAHIGTSLADSNGNKVVAAETQALLVDTVTYNNLDTSRSYQLAGEVYLVDEGQAAELLASTQRTFTPSLSHGTLELSFEVDTSMLAGRSLVCFERLSDSSGAVIAEHADASDEGQTVSVPAIGTTLVDTATGEHVATFADAGAYELTDTVAYAGLAPGRTYTLAGTLYDKAAGSPLLDSRGQPVTATRMFTPREVDGTVDMTFSFTLKDAAGTQIVAFESLTCQGAEYAVHTDMTDEGQTVSVPAIGTELTDQEHASHVSAAQERLTLIDTVAFEGLVPGRTYRAVGTLYGKETGFAVENADGSAVTGSAEFTPEAPAGTVDVAFDVPGDVAGTALVAFETVESGGRTYVEHADLSNESQTVYVPAIKTTLLDVDTESHEALVGTSHTLIDAIAYEGLQPGQTYVVTGTLYDKQTGKPAQGALEGDSGASTQRELTASTEFTAEESRGVVDVRFAFDADVAGRTLVAFEQIADEDGRILATHEDLDDANQSVRFPTPPQPAAKAAPSAIAKTGDSLVGIVLVLIPAGVIGLGLASLAVRRLEQEKAIAIERGRPRR